MTLAEQLDQIDAQIAGFTDFGGDAARALNAVGAPQMVAALRAVATTIGPHYDAEVRRNAKFGRIGSDCVCETCRAIRGMVDALSPGKHHAQL